MEKVEVGRALAFKRVQDRLAKYLACIPRPAAIRKNTAVTAIIRDLSAEYAPDPQQLNLDTSHTQNPRLSNWRK